VGTQTRPVIRSPHFPKEAPVHKPPALNIMARVPTGPTSDKTRNKTRDKPGQHLPKGKPPWPEKPKVPLTPKKLAPRGKLKKEKNRQWPFL